jgi:hypothetical protein
MFGESSFTAEHSSEQRIESADAALHKVQEAATAVDDEDGSKYRTATCLDSTLELPPVQNHILVNKSQEPLGNILQSINQLGVHSSNSGSDISSSEDLSSCHSDELNEAPTPCASQASKRNYSFSDGKYSANNEVVCGHEHSMIPIKASFFSTQWNIHVRSKPHLEYNTCLLVGTQERYNARAIH